MPRVSVRAGRAAIRPPKTRGRIVAESLTASARDTNDALVSMYDLARGSLCDRLFQFQTLEAGYVELSGAAWPSDATSVADVDGEILFRQDGDVVYRLRDGSYAHVEVGHGWAHARISGPSYDAVYGALAAFQTLYPATYLSATGDRVPVTFWTLGRMGPERRLRMIDASPWSAVEENYPAETRGEVAALMDGFAPGKSGQLLLWQGPPGTGKTWALRALASEWLPWAEFHFITDPDSFFVDDPSYMIEVLCAETYQALDESGQVFHENAQDGKWRVLILEDTGELLSATAKEKYGQGLSRLLNVVDGMIGQGLRILCLVTTNDELGELNAAVRRPGRCASQIVFPAFPADEASAWLGEDVAGEMTVAEMYDRRGNAAEALAADEEPSDDVRAEIARVAEAHQDEATGYGAVRWDASTGTVLYVGGDWTDTDPIEADFLAIDGVENFVSEAEGMPDGWCDAEPVYGSDFTAACEEQAQARAQEFEFNPDQARDDHGRWAGDGSEHTGGSKSADVPRTTPMAADVQAVDAQIGKIAESHALQTTYLSNGAWDVKTIAAVDPNDPPISAATLQHYTAPGYPEVWQARYSNSGGGLIGNFTSPAEALAEVARTAP